MNTITRKTKNPAQLLRLFVFFTCLSFILIILFAGVGIYKISQISYIKEAEHDAITLSRAFLEDEGDILSMLISPGDLNLQKVNKPRPSPVGAKSYTIQVGSFSKKSGAIEVFELLKDKLPYPDQAYLRVEKVASFFTVRIGRFSSNNKSSPLFKKVKKIIPLPIVLPATINKNRIILSTNNPSWIAINTSGDSLEKDGSVVDSFDKRMRNHLKTLGIMKIKIFSHESVVYSTDPSIINNKLSPKDTLAHMALAGEVNSKFKTKDAMVDTVGEKRIDRDVVETYVPVHSDNGEVIGAFELYLDITRYRQDLKKRVTESVATLSVVMFVVFSILIYLMYMETCELTKIQDKLLKLSTIDTLTGLANRRFLFERFAAEFKRMSQDEKRKQDIDSMGCIMIDIDYFKRFNDTYGHQIGDMIINHVAQRIEESIRPYDIAGRYGGEEFMVILPNSSKDDTQAVAERIWHKIRSEKYETDGKDYEVSVSMGITNLTNDDDCIDNAIKRADQSLYKAKETGRDRICDTDGCKVM